MAGPRDQLIANARQSIAMLYSQLSQIFVVIVISSEKNTAGVRAKLEELGISLSRTTYYKPDFSLVLVFAFFFVFFAPAMSGLIGLLTSGAINAWRGFSLRVLVGFPCLWLLPLIVVFLAKYFCARKWPVGKPFTGWTNRTWGFGLGVGITVGLLGCVLYSGILFWTVKGLFAEEFWKSVVYLPVPVTVAVLTALCIDRKTKVKQGRLRRSFLWGLIQFVAMALAVVMSTVLNWLLGMQAQELPPGAKYLAMGLIVAFVSIVLGSVKAYICEMATGFESQKDMLIMTMRRSIIDKCEQDGLARDDYSKISEWVATKLASRESGAVAWFRRQGMLDQDGRLTDSGAGELKDALSAAT